MDDAMLYETSEDSFLFGINDVRETEKGWITIRAMKHLGVSRRITLNFSAARALAYKLLAIAGNEAEE